MYDVIVVGSGPSGSMAAKTCANNGLKVLLLEKESLPRYKTCGGAVSKKAIDLIGPLEGLEPKYKGFGVIAYSPNLKCSATKTNDLSMLLTFRDSFDYFLLQKAEESGAEIHTNERVTSVTVEKEHVIVGTTEGNYLAKIIIGADGVTSLVAKETGLRKKWEQKGVGICIETEVELSSSDIEQFVNDRELIEIYFLKSRGYGWVFPKGNILSIGVGLWKPLTEKPSDAFDDFINFLSNNKKYDISKKITEKYAHMIPAGGLNRKIYGERVLLVGDAAGFVDPFLGEGIYYAVASGIAAGEISSEAVKCNKITEKDLCKFEKKCDALFNNDLKFALKCANIAYNNLERLFHLFNADPYLFEKYVLTGRGDYSYKKYFTLAIRRLPITSLKIIKSVL